MMHVLNKEAKDTIKVAAVPAAPAKRDGK